MDPTIRDLEESEIGMITELWSAYDLPYKPRGRDAAERIREEMRGDRCRYIVAEAEGRIVGSVLVTHDGRKGWMNRLVVVDEFRRKGIARALLLEGEKWLGDQGIGIFACLIEGGNTVSEKVFESMGYSEFPGVKYFTKRTHPDI